MEKGEELVENDLRWIESERFFIDRVGVDCLSDIDSDGLNSGLLRPLSRFKTWKLVWTIMLIVQKISPATMSPCKSSADDAVLIVFEPSNAKPSTHTDRMLAAAKRASAALLVRE